MLVAKRTSDFTVLLQGKGLELGLHLALSHYVSFPGCAVGCWRAA